MSDTPIKEKTVKAPSFEDIDFSFIAEQHDKAIKKRFEYYNKNFNAKLDGYRSPHMQEKLGRNILLRFNEEASPMFKNVSAYKFWSYIIVFCFGAIPAAFLMPPLAPAAMVRFGILFGVAALGLYAYDKFIAEKQDYQNLEIDIQNKVHEQTGLSKTSKQSELDNAYDAFKNDPANQAWINGTYHYHRLRNDTHLFFPALSMGMLGAYLFAGFPIPALIEGFSMIALGAYAYYKAKQSENRAVQKAFEDVYDLRP